MHLAWAILLLLLALHVPTAAAEQKCSISAPQCPDTGPRLKFSLDFVPHILRALQEFQPCGAAQCSCHALTIRRDLESYAGTGITQRMIAQSRRFGTLYKLLNGRLYRQLNCTHPVRCAAVEQLLLGVCAALPNLEFVLNVRDWPQVHFLSGWSGPVFSYSITNHHLDIMYPAWSFWDASGPTLQQYPLGIGRWDLMRHHLAAAAVRLPWARKQPIGFFRGAPSSAERNNLVLLSALRPDLVDAQYSEQDVNNSTLPFAAYCQYKYLFNFRGIAASFRLRHILLCKSLVLHVGEQWQEFFYFSLKPWVHYVPVSSKASVEDLEELILYLRLHDDLAQQIAERGYAFVWQHLRLQDIQCYWQELLTAYAKLMTYEAQLELDFYEVSHTALQLHWKFV